MSNFLSIFEQDEVPAKYFERIRAGGIAWSKQSSAQALRVQSLDQAQGQGLSQDLEQAQAKAKSQRLQNPLSIVRTKAWFAAVVKYSGIDSPQHLHELISLHESIDGLKDGINLNNKRWNMYKVGKKTPRVEYVRLVEERFPGAAGVFFSALWLVLKKDFSKEDSSVFYSMISIVEKRALRVEVDIDGEIIGSVGIKSVKELERMATFDSLACLIFLIRAGDDVFDFDFGREKVAYSILNCLAYMNFELSIFGIVHELCGLIFERVIHLGESDDVGFDLSVRRFVIDSVTLNLSSLYVCLKKHPGLPARARKDSGCVESGFQSVIYSNENRSCMFDMLHGVENGLDLILMMRPRYRVKGLSGADNRDLNILVSERNSLQGEARRVAFYGRGGWFPAEAALIYDFVAF